MEKEIRVKVVKVLIFISLVKLVNGIKLFMIVVIDLNKMVDLSGVLVLVLILLKIWGSNLFCDMEKEI